MRIVIFMVAAFLLFAAPALCLRWGFPKLWDRWMNRAVLGLYGLLLTAIGLFFYFRPDAPDHAQAAVTTAHAIVLAGLGVVLTSILWAPLMVWYRKREKQEIPPDPQRRALILNTARTIPAAATLLSPVGVQAAMSAPILNPVTIPVKDLPPGLESMKILQLTDIHLGVHIDPDQIEHVVSLAQEHQPDLVVLTGDIADDYTKLPPSLDALKTLNPSLGIFACIGNHEIYRGRREAENIYRTANIPLLCNDGVRLTRNGDSFWLAGADDPARLFRNRKTFYQKTVQQALNNKPDDVPTSILLCHRPIGFNAAAKQEVTLTLSGHTHGGQMAFAGRSIFEPFLPRSFLMGHYQEGESHLYTSVGLGHWLPFRLNCPCEAVLLTLTASQAKSA